MQSAKELLLTYIRYNLWANEKLAAVISGIDPGWPDKEIPSSFPSIRKTAFHIWDAEYIWLSRFKGVSLSTFPSTEFSGSVEPTRFTEGAKAFLEFAEAQDDAFFGGETTYANTKGRQFTQPNAAMIFHCMNHSTFHRGQLITMIRVAGHEGALPSTDMVTYYRERNY